MRRSVYALLASVATLVLVGELLSLGAHGTFASYNAQVGNPTASVESGTLTLATRTPSATGPLCLSNGGPVGAPATNANKTCTLTLTGGPFHPGQTTSVSMRLVNTGSTNAGNLRLFAPASCTGTLCGQVEVTVQETKQTGANLKCFYPTAATTCVPSTTGTLTTFEFTYTSPGDGLILAGGLRALNSRYVTIALTFRTYTSPTLGNPYQGGTAKFSFAWYVGQAAA